MDPSMSIVDSSWNILTNDLIEIVYRKLDTSGE